MVLMMNGKTNFAHIFAAITNISVVDRYLTVTRPLHVRYIRYSPSNTQALDIVGTRTQGGRGGIRTAGEKGSFLPTLTQGTSRRPNSNASAP